MKTLISTLKTAALTLTVLAVGSVANAAQVTGSNLKAVGYNNAAGQFGAFYQTGPKTWKEEAPDGLHHFTELYRDAWSVYLRKTDGALIQLDAYTNSVIITDITGARRKLYDIRLKRNVNGRIGTQVLYKDAQRNAYGQFAKTGQNRWTEYTPDGRTYSLTEERRDDWTISLRKADGALVQLNLHTNAVMYTQVDGQRYKIYDITDAR